MSKDTRDKARQHMPRRGPGGHGFGVPVEKAKDFKGTIKRLATYFKPRRASLILIFIFAIISTVFGIVGPKVLGKATTKLFEGFMGKLMGVPGAAIDFEYILHILLILAGLYAISAIFSYIMQFMMASVVHKTVYEMREELSQKLNRLPLKYFDSYTHGEVLSRVTNDMDNISNTLSQSVLQLITGVVTIIGSIVMMLSISPVLTLIALLTLPLSILATKKIAGTSQKFFKAQQKTLGKLNGHVEEMYSGHREVKAFNYEKTSISRFEEENEALYEVGWKAQFISGIIMPTMNFINNIGYVLISAAGAIFVIRGVITVGDVQAFIQYSRQFGQPIVQTANIANIIQSTIASAERVFEVLDEEIETVDSADAIDAKHTEGRIELENVKFGYSKDKILMTDLSMSVNKGQTVAIVGPTGAGKTTLVNLLMRFYDVDGGSISIDGNNIMDIKRDSLRNLFGMVLQDTWLFNGSIRDNIAYGNENATDEDIRNAAKASHADHFIRTLPEGYDTVLTEDAGNISEGQKQLITIARAILKDPEILILDEATSSVDTRTEHLIQRAMDNLMRGRTSFVIAHRLSTIREADIILVMNEGDIVEKGTHSELLKADGFYAELYNSQFRHTA